MDHSEVSKTDIGEDAVEVNDCEHEENSYEQELSETNSDFSNDVRNIDECAEVTSLDSVESTENDKFLSSVKSGKEQPRKLIELHSTTDSNAIPPSSDPDSVCQKASTENMVHESQLTSTESIPSKDKLTVVRDRELVNGIAKDKMYFRQKLNKEETIIKMENIIHALENNDIKLLRNAALTPGGLLNDNIRRKVWPKIVGVDVAVSSPRPSKEEIEGHPYYQQVVLDVNRSLKRFPPSIQETQRLAMLDQLVTLIMRILCKHPELHYYQGYHDICVTFLLVLGEETAFHVVEKLSRTHLQIFMEKSMEPTIHLLENIYHIIGKIDPMYKNFLLKSEVGVAYCLSWLITWFSHVLNDYNTVVRFFDFFIASHYWMPMYVTASLVLYRELEVIQQDCDMASVHSLLCNIPDKIPSEDLLTEAIKLFNSYKPSFIMKERPYIKVKNRRKITKWTYFSRIRYIPTTLVVAAAFLFTAYIYQVYKH